MSTSSRAAARTDSAATRSSHETERVGAETAGLAAPLQSRLGNQQLSAFLRARFVQPKLEVSQPNDPLEHEADRLAREGAVTTSTDTPGAGSGSMSVQRACSKCEEEELSRKPMEAPLTVSRVSEGGQSGATIDASFESAVHGLSSRTASPLPKSVHPFVQRLGVDPGAVRVHMDAELAGKAEAKAFTHGANIVFNPAHYAPGTPSGDELIRHECVHVAQQGKAASRSSDSIARQPLDPRQTLREQSRRVMWFEMYPGVLSLVPPQDTTLDRVAAYVSGNPEVGRALSGVNGIARNATIPQGQPILVPVELIDRMQAVRDMPEAIGEQVLARQRVSASNQAFRNFATVRAPHGSAGVGPIPLSLRTAEHFGAVTMDVVERFVTGLGHLIPDRVLYVIAFNAGTVHGFLQSIGDTVGALWHLMKSVLTLRLISEIGDLIDRLRSVSWQDIRSSIGSWAERWDEQLQSPDPGTAGHARGYLTGYVMAEAAMLLFSGGLLTELKSAIWTSRLGEILKGSRAMQTLAKGVTMIAEAADAVAPVIAGLRGSRLGALVRAAELTGTAIAWTANRVAWVLDLPSSIAQYIAERMLAHVKQLERFFPRIERLSERGKKWLFGCHSPCDWDSDGVERVLAGKTDAEIEKSAEVAEAAEAAGQSKPPRPRAVHPHPHTVPRPGQAPTQPPPPARPHDPIHDAPTRPYRDAPVPQPQAPTDPRPEDWISDGVPGSADLPVPKGIPVRRRNPAPPRPAPEAPSPPPPSSVPREAPTSDIPESDGVPELIDYAPSKTISTRRPGGQPEPAPDPGSEPVPAPEPAGAPRAGDEPAPADPDTPRDPESARQNDPAEADNTPSIEAHERPNPPIENEPAVIVHPSAGMVSRKMMMGFIRSAMQVSENLLRGMKPPGGRGGLAARLFAANHTLADLRYLRNHVLPASGLSLSPEAARLYERTAAELQRKVKALSDEAFPPNKSLHEQGPVPVKKPAAPAQNPIPFPSLRGGKKN